MRRGNSNTTSTQVRRTHATGTRRERLEHRGGPQHSCGEVQGSHASKVTVANRKEGCAEGHDGEAEQPPSPPENKHTQFVTSVSVPVHATKSRGSVSGKYAQEVGNPREELRERRILCALHHKENGESAENHGNDADGDTVCIVAVVVKSCCGGGLSEAHLRAANGLGEAQNNSTSKKRGRVGDAPKRR